ncbi:MAG: CHASE2 domain-containing protein, partial [candidate division KSB1 bacterium]|nr:CHASE2 domain-containing protein [candidate division KSB1 bacterium]
MKSSPLTKKEGLILLIGLIISICFGSHWSDLQSPLNDVLHKRLQSQSFKYPIKIVYFDDSSINQLGGWPVSRNLYSYLIHILNQLGVAIIGVDVFFPQTKPFLDEDDLLLVEMNQRFDNIVNSFYFTTAPADSLPSSLPIAPLELIELSNHHIKAVTPGYIQLPFQELLQANPRAGFSNVTVDTKGIIRTVPLLIKIGEKLYPSFSLRIAIEYLKKRPPVQKPLSLLNVLNSPLKRNYQIHYTAASENLEVFSALEL